MYIQLFIYQIVGNKWISIIFKICIICLISYFNAKYSLCAPKLQDLSCLSDQQFVEFFFEWITNIDLANVKFEGQNILENHLNQQKIDEFNTCLQRDFQTLTAEHNRVLNIDEISALRKNTQHLLRQSASSSGKMDSEKSIQIEEDILKIVQKSLPKLQRGTLLKNYIDRNDFRSEIKTEIKNFIFKEEKAIAQYVYENFFKTFRLSRTIIQRIGN